MSSEPDWESDFGGQPEARKSGLLAAIRDRLSLRRVRERLKLKTGAMRVEDPPLEAIAEAPSQAEAEVLAFKPPKPSV